MKILRIVALLLVVLMTTTVFAACGKKTADGDSASGSADGSGDSVAITVVKDGETDFVIIKPEKCTKNELDGAFDIFKAYRSEYEVVVGNRDDSETRKDGVYEIIIGNTNRPETVKARELLIQKSNMYAEDYIICAIDGNIVIYSITDEMLPMAVNRFVDTYVAMAEIPDDLADVNATEGDFETVTIGGDSKLYDFSIVRSHFETSYLTQLELENLHNVLREKTGHHVPIVEDAYKQAGDREIIIGGCNREGQTVDKDDMDFYEIKVEGTKVYISGGSDYAVAVGVREFTDMIKNGTTSFADGILKTGDYKDTVAKYDGSEYKLVWSDEFDDVKIDEEKWRIYHDHEFANEAPDGKPVYRSTDASTFLYDGKLYMLALKDDKAYYGGMINTYYSLHYQYGYIEIKAKVPDGDGFWAGFWLNGSNWGGGSTVPDRYMFGEFDIMESYGNATGFTPALHRWPTQKGLDSGIEGYLEHTIPTYSEEYANNRKVWCPDGKLFSDDFHTFGCMWTDEKITMTVDGLKKVELDTTLDPIDEEAFNGYEFIVLSLATYFKSCPLTPNATEEEWENTNKYIVEYVRLFQNDKCDIRWF